MIFRQTILLCILGALSVSILEAQLIEDSGSRISKPDSRRNLSHPAEASSSDSADAASALSSRDWAYAREFAPVFCQDFGPPIPGLSVPTGYIPSTSTPTAHADYITRFNFDGNWTADDNWKNFESPGADFRAAVYFYPVETETHYYLFYAVYHPRDWGSIHENDLEGVLVAVEKSRSSSSSLGRPVFMETLSHNVFLKYHNPALGPYILGSLGKFLLEGNHPMVFIEQRGHGIHGLSDGLHALLSQPGKFVVYRQQRQGEHPARSGLQNVGYELLPLYSTFWERAKSGTEADRIFCQYRTYGPFSVNSLPGRGNRSSAGTSFRAGASLCGNDGRPNAAHLPWAWSLDGRWFFLPAETIQKDFHQTGNPFSTVYLHHPVLGVFR
jgi:hypothetical protein